jgi:hypothetical protein
MAAFTIKLLGCQNVVSLKTAIRGWNDYEQPLVDHDSGPVDIDENDEFLSNKVRKD